MLNYQMVRRALHQIPEIGFQEVKTQAFLLETIGSFPQDHLTVKTWRTGILVRINGTDPKQTIGYRCDMDGLPIKEETGYPFSSQHEGYMHACGHDFHMTIALLALEQLAEQPPADDTVIIFQPAEEGPGGAQPIMTSPIFQEWKPDMIFALHIAPEYQPGVIAIKEGLLFANTSELFIDFKGKGGHAAFPHLTHDMVVAASAFIMNCQSAVSRAVNPTDAAVITIGKVVAGEKQNIIAGNARLEGTLRALKPETMSILKRKIEDHVKAIEIAYECDAVIDYGANYYQVYNDPALTNKFIGFAENEGFALQYCEAQMTGEDFGYFLKDIPGFMFWLGVDSEAGLHSSRLKPREEAIPVARDLVVRAIRSSFHN